MFKIKYYYDYFKLTGDQVEQLKKATDAESLCELGGWYLFTVPSDDYVERAADCLRRAAEMGSSQAKLHLANMYRLGDFGKVDMNEYKRLLSEAMAEGCQDAEIRFCKDIAYGVGQLPDNDAAIAEGRRRLAAQQNPSPRWYDMLGWMLLEKHDADTNETNALFQKAIDGGFVDSYSGLVDVPDAFEKGRQAGCGDCCILLADKLEELYSECEMDDANVVDCFSDDHNKQAYLAANSKHRDELTCQIVALYEEAVRLGSPSGYYYHGMIYYRGHLSYKKDYKKAWDLFMRGSKMGNPFCYSMLADMIDEGVAPERFKWEDQCLFRLMALRLGDDEQLLDVVHDYAQGGLNDYADEMESCYMPRYRALEDEVCMNPDKDYDDPDEEEYDDDYEDDDGRYDPWA